VRWIPQAGSSFSELSVRENLELAAQAEGAANINGAIELFPAIESLLSRQVRHLSSGERKMTDLAVLAFLSEATLFWLDEPVASLSQYNAERFERFLGECVTAGTSVLLATHVRNLEPITTQEICLAAHA